MASDDEGIWKAILYLSSSLNQMRGAFTEIAYRREQLGLNDQEMEEIHNRLNESHKDFDIVLNEIRKRYGVKSND